MCFFKSSSAAILLCILSVLFCISCIREDLAEQPEQQPAIVRLEVRGERQAGAMTRVNETQINDLHILIYDSSGELIGQKYTTTGSGTISVNTHSANNCTIYAIANTGDANLFGNSNIHSEGSLKQMVHAISTWDELAKGTTLPMTGSKPNVNITAGKNTLELKVSHMTAKIVLNIGVAPGYRMSIRGYHIYGIPKKAYYVLRPLGTETDQSDTQSTRAGDATLPTNSSDWTDSGDLSLTSPVSSIKTTFYMFENRPGINSAITQQKDKIKANAPDSAAYVVIYGQAAGYFSISWKVYLGATNTGNFNIKRSSTYTYNITLRPNRSDTRITYERDTRTIWAGSNIYWDGTKLTFDETPLNDSDLKQGVFFRWGSLIGIPSSGSTAPTKYFIPKYNPDDPKSSTWEYKEYAFRDIHCFYGENIASIDSRTNTFLNDAAQNTDASYLAYKGDICQYLCKTGAVPGDWRMPTSQEFEGTYQRTGNWGSSISTNIYGTTVINDYITLNSNGRISRFPAANYRIANGTLNNASPTGWYWSSSATSENSKAYILRFSNSYLNSAEQAARNCGFPVRAVRN